MVMVVYYVTMTKSNIYYGRMDSDGNYMVIPNFLENGWWILPNDQGDIVTTDNVVDDSG